MPYEVTQVLTPGGVRVVRAQAEGRLDEAELNDALPRIRDAGLPVMVVLIGNVKFTPEGRKRLFATTKREKPKPAAIVSKSAAMRAMMSFVMKALALATRQEASTAMFADEESALAWLEERESVNAAAAAA